ncbi:GDSL-type esterase/lipase family protein [Curtobacterium aetherium]|uniref:Uncharacterized protein n=1 Tax=Curtobacterium aetherium TaxID=2841594 RepID=A0ACD1E0L7_9MICO|nr:GDSL-type esterase/lipase family protein [Curtobacterium sp. L6-1]QWS32301.1 hypothetical protein KM842_08190 [Curtobacterium sp. L6-1]
MSRVRSILQTALTLPARSARFSEFVFRRSDAAFDVFPDDPAAGEVPGAGLDRVLFIGERGELSLGVRTHELSIPAFFARHRAAQYGRGTAWSIASCPSSSIRQLPAVVRGHREQLRECQLVVVMVGITDSLSVMAPATWERHLRDTVEALHEALPRDARVMVGEIPPLDNAGSLSRAARVAAGVHGRALNARSRAVAEDLDRVDVVDFPEELTRSVWRPEAEEHRYRDTYAVWGAHLADHV